MKNRRMTSWLHGLFRLVPVRIMRQLLQHYRTAQFRVNPNCPERDIVYADQANIPQEMQFAIDCLPVLSELLQAYPRNQELRLLDFGPGFGAGGNLFAQLFCSTFLWCPVRVDALDKKSIRAPLARFDYPLVNYRIGELDQLEPSEHWDIIYCSNVIEHTDDPGDLINRLRQRTKDWLILYAPLEEHPLSAGHQVTLTEAFFLSLEPAQFQIKHSLAWNATPNARQALVVLKGAYHSDSVDAQ
jgi:2-polyprenyl-3-methyl-5-hydroxy-6-metoxy-1,4-benzoquinol methylase